MRQSFEQVPRPLIVCGATLAMAIFLFVGRLFPILALAEAEVVLMRELLLLLLSAGLVLFVVKVEGLPASALGWRPRASSLGWGGLIAIALVVSSIPTNAVMRAFGLTQDTTILARLAGQPAWLLLLVALTAGISEELAFRAVLIAHVDALTRSRYLGAIVSVLAFSAFHVNGWGTKQFLFVLPSATILTASYLWKRDIIACAFGHALTDVVGLLSAAASMQQH